MKTDPSSDERRESARTKHCLLVYWVPVGGDEAASLPAVLRDLSAKGLRLAIDRHVEPRTVVKIRFPGNSLVAWTQVVYSVKQAADLWLTGCSFLTTMPEDWLRTFNRDYGPLCL